MGLPFTAVLVRLRACRGSRGGFMRCESDFDGRVLVDGGVLEILRSVQYAVEKGSIGI